jgi:hypothetical protein
VTAARPSSDACGSAVQARRLGLRKALIVAVYGVVSFGTAPFIVPDANYVWPGSHGTLHERIVSWTEPSIFQHRWLVPLVAESLHRASALAVPQCYLLVAVASMWLLLVTFHKLLRRQFRHRVCFAGGTFLLLAFISSRPGAFFHPYDLLCAWCVVMAVAAVLGRSIVLYALSMAVLTAVKWQAALPVIAFFTPAWFGSATTRSVTIRGVLAGGAAFILVVAAVHAPVLGWERLLHPYPASPPGYAAHMTNKQLLHTFAHPTHLRFLVAYMLPAIMGVKLGYRRVTETWRRLLWYPVGLFVTALVGHVMIYETRTYFTTYVIFIPFLLTGILARPSNDRTRGYREVRDD